MRTVSLLLLTSAALILWPGQPARAHAPPRYRLTVLPLTVETNDVLDNIDFGGGIRDTQIVGLRTIQRGSLSDQWAALWRQSHPLRVLDRTPVTNDPQSNSYAITFPTDVNRRGIVVGAAYCRFSGAWSGSSCAAVLWRNGKRKNIPGFPGNTDSIALGINDLGVIVGNYTHNNHNPVNDMDDLPPGVGGNHAFLIRNGRVKNLWPGIALGINNRGWLVGVKDVGFDVSHAKGVLWRKGRVTLLKMQPVAINERGEIAGNIPITEDTGRACVWRRGRVTFLSEQISHAYALNDRGAVVGERDDPASSHPARAALWRRGRAYDLNRCVGLPANWVLQSATGINDKGWIIGNGSIYKTPKDKQPAAYFSFLLTPR
jgi:uncharacterized membrane protein